MLQVLKSNVNIISGQYRKRIQSKLYKNKIKDIEEKYLDEVLSELSEETVFLHVGLGSIKRAFKINNAYDFLMHKLNLYFKNIMVPGFTLDYFKKTGIYHKKFSYPHKGLGEFSKQFFENDADYRTNDAIHSILVKGDYRFDECNHFNSFAMNSCFGKLNKENVLILNIGTYELKASQIHFIDNNYNPNINKKSYKGIIYYDETNFEKIEQINFEPARNMIGLQYNWNRPKLVKELKNDGILKDYSYNGFKIYAFKSNDLRMCLAEKIKNNPYYLIT